LALLLDVNDAAPRRSADLWSGSCIELFAAPESNRMTGGGSDPSKVRQCFLMPGAGSEPPPAVYQDRAPKGIPRARLESHPRDGGYVLSVLIPLELLRVPPTSDRFLVELAANTHLPESRRASMFDALGAYGNTGGYGTMIVF